MKSRISSLILSKRNFEGFTLVELLVVLAITSILMGLILGPLIEGFNLTNLARVQVLTQATTQQAMDTIKSDISEGVFIDDNSGSPVNMWVPGSVTPIQLPFAMVDIVPPLHVNDENPNIPIDPTTGLPMENLRGPVSKPLSPGRIIIRYWLGLRDNTSVNNIPVKPYYNVYADPLHRDVTANNTMILYRAVVTPYLSNGQVDQRFFHADSTGRNILDLEDPNFFYDTTTPPSGLPPIPGYPGGQPYGTIAQNWKAIAEPVVNIDQSDEVIVPYDQNNNPSYNETTALVQFQPTAFLNDFATASSTSDPGNQTPWIPASAMFLNHGYWTNNYSVAVYHNSGDVYTWNYDGSTNPPDALHNGSDSGWNPYTETINNISTFNGLLFSVDPRRGMVNFSFPLSVINNGVNVQTYDAHYDANRWKEFGWSNYRFINLLWNSQVGMQDPTSSPSPAPTPTLSNIGQLAKNNGDIRIVPGSEVVIGPDMHPGPNYGQPITYTRVSRDTDPMLLGPDEYMINYGNNYNIQNYDPNNLGYGATVIFDSKTDPVNTAQTDALPENAAPITISYKVQNNRDGDFVEANYLSRQVMQFTLGVRMYDFHSSRAYQVSLAQKVPVFDLLR